MSPKLTDNADLLEYLARIAQILRDQSHEKLAQEADRAGLFASGSPSEFLHEAHASLERVARAKPAGIELGEVYSIIDQIKEAFRNVGGA